MAERFVLPSWDAGDLKRRIVPGVNGGLDQAEVLVGCKCPHLPADHDYDHCLADDESASDGYCACTGHWELEP